MLIQLTFSPNPPLFVNYGTLLILLLPIGLLLLLIGAILAVIAFFRERKKRRSADTPASTNKRTERVPVLRLHKGLLVVTVVLALPFLTFGSLVWITAATTNNAFRLYEIGDSAYSLGMPLTLAVLKFPTYAGRGLQTSDHWWAIPLIDTLFVLQWIIWGQLSALVIRAFRTTLGKY